HPVEAAMPKPRMKQRRVVHKSTAGILKPIPEAVDLVGNPPPGLTTKTVALLHQRGTANHWCQTFAIMALLFAFGYLLPASRTRFHRAAFNASDSRFSLAYFPGLKVWIFHTRNAYS